MQFLFVFSGLLVWILIPLFNKIKTGDFRHPFNFSVKNYYLLMSAFLIYPVWQAIIAHSFTPLIFLLIFAMAGVLGETLFSVWWHLFFEKRFWVYRVETLAHSYTSLLNFIPWGVGGMIFISIVQFLGSRLPLSSVDRSIPVPFYVTFAIFVMLGLAIQLVVWIPVFKGRKFKEVNFWNYTFFCLPYILGLSVCYVLCGKIFLVFALLFAVIAAGAEYLFGKATEFFISKKLWTYSYEAMDNGHFTPLSLVPFSLAGFYFWSIALIYQSLR